MRGKTSILLLALVMVLFFQQSFAQITDGPEAEQVKNVLSSYKEAIEALEACNTANLFAKDSKIFESGSVEGTYSHYLDHHLAPELNAFKSFTYSDYKVDVQVDGAYAFATETYMYTIVLAKDGSTIKKKGVTTSTLKKNNGKWEIVSLHNSSRNTK
ncbi:uncharacterized protein (TIGR02246 family) [Pontibacter mucosus]|uniref:Uncharacterized protein (TIGR02246 family) n=1 Tax=Pontibacter mucosus TaxID=1649266 RepID=A0A2T5Y9Q3_9BACT|nr:nuclear transport factor 2 family protein [Pontibacter mucosus]PTX13096.1 uncharacterized protein (TIGR02246 family) [Pontibacter mucosus]